MVKEGILEISVEWLSAFRSEMVALVGARSLTFREFQACGTPDYHGVKDLIVSRRSLEDVVNAFRTNTFPEGAKYKLSSCLLKDKARDWREEVWRVVGDEVVDSMTRDDL